MTLIPHTLPPRRSDIFSRRSQASPGRRNRLAERRRGSIGRRARCCLPSFGSARLQVSTTKPPRHRWIDRSGPGQVGGHWAGLDDTTERGCPVQRFPRLIHPENTRKDISGLGGPLVWFLSHGPASPKCNAMSPSIFQPSLFTCSLSSTSHISPFVHSGSGMDE